MNRFLEWARHNKLFRAVYKYLRLAPLYHWTFAFLGSLVYPVNKSLVVIGVTGTKGKTTTLELLNSILEAHGDSTAFLSSSRMKIGGTTAKNMTGNSMPGRMYLNRFLYRAGKSGCRYALIEVTSEGVKLHRHKFLPWNVAVLTNLAPEHIEAHGSFENYRDAKGQFLTEAARHNAAIFLNEKDEHSGFYTKLVRRARPQADVVVFSDDDLPWIDEVKTAKPPVDGLHKFFLQFNRENAAAARAVSVRLGVSEDVIRRALEAFRGVPGRMEFVQTEPFAAVVDYAHTPDSLMKAYDSLRDSPYRAPKGRLIAVLGSCGGGRDKWKRPIMGRIAAEYCDEIILTNEDSYDENPEQVLRDIAAGFATAQNRKFSAPESYRMILDRREALAAAVADAKPGDVVVATGKGSESWIHLEKGRLLPWNEKEAMEQALARLKKAP